ncbi:MAG: GLUG motif-containing protein, partial [Planctomycetota bacterium]
VSGCYALGDVTSSGSYAGGLIGHSLSGTISGCSAKGNISATGSYGGGLIGYKDNGDIVMCYALGNVSSAETGGLVGRSQSSTNIYDSFAHGHVANTDSLGNAGGLIGYANGGGIYGCYSVGIISGLATLKGGLVGDGFGHSVYDSYWDIEISQQPTSSGGGVGLPTKDMKKQFNYAGWDFDTVWRIEEGFNYPLHREFPIGDLNRDRKVDFFDLVILSNHWLEDFNI